MTSGESPEASRLPPPVSLHHRPDGQQELTAGNGAGGQGEDRYVVLLLNLLLPYSQRRSWPGNMTEPIHGQAVSP